MTNCTCFSLWEELNWKMRAFEEKLRILSRLKNNQSLKGQHNLLKQQENMAFDLKEIEITLDVLSLCPNFACKSHVSSEYQNKQISEYLLGPMREKTIRNWVADEIEEDFGIDGSCLAELILNPDRCLPEAQPDSPNEVQSKSGWILVYGFTRNLLPLVLATFSQIGEVISCEKPVTGNWAAFHYVLSEDANRALRLHKTLMDGQVIGVTNQEDFIQKTLRNHGCASREESPGILSPIRSLRKPKIETSTNCPAPVTLTGWRQFLHYLMDLLYF